MRRNVLTGIRAARESGSDSVTDVLDRLEDALEQYKGDKELLDTMWCEALIVVGDWEAQELALGGLWRQSRLGVIVSRAPEEMQKYLLWQAKSSSHEAGAKIEDLGDMPEWRRGRDA